jgi:drug/metabolite transporter (DMT)-like permease
MLNSISLVVFTVSLAIGQVLFKKAALGVRGGSLSEVLVTAMSQPALYVGLALYGVVTVLWIWILSRVPLAQAYPFVAAGVFLVPMGGILLFGERVSYLFWIGAAFVAVGILLTQYGIEPSR